MPLKEKLKKMTRKIKRAVLRDEPGYYDMFLNTGESFFARIYLHEIGRRLEETVHPEPVEGKRHSLEVLDAGCQTGRISVPLASMGHRVTGVDTSGLALDKARRHAREAGTRLKLVRADLGAWLPRTPAASFDAVVCTEVLYLRPNHKELLEGLVRVLRPGGFCFISHRPPGYYIVEAAGRKDWEAARTVLNGQEGELFGSYYNWQKKEELEKTYAGLGITGLRITPVGLLGWLVTPPDRLDDAGREQLFEAELALAKQPVDTGRYLLVSGQKTR